MNFMPNLWNRLRSPLGSKKYFLFLVLLGLNFLTGNAFAGWRETTLDKAHNLSVKAFFKEVCSAQTIYYIEEHVDPDGRVLGPHFISAGPTPNEIPRGKEVDANWDVPGWRELGISPAHPVAFRYQVIAEGAGEKANFKIRAEADLVSDGKLTVYEMLGKINSKGTPACGELIRVSQ